MKWLASKKYVLVITFLLVFVAAGAYILATVEFPLKECREVRSFGGTMVSVCEGRLVSQSFSDAILVPVFFTSLSLLLSLLPLLFTRESIYRAWRTFALWYWVIVLGLILLAPGDGGHDYVPMGATREETALVFSILFVLVSWVITLVRYIRLSKE